MRTLVLLFAVALVAAFTQAPAPAAGHSVDIRPDCRIARCGAAGRREAARTVDDHGLRPRFPFAPGTAGGRDVRRRSAASVALARSRGRGLAGQAPDSRFCAASTRLSSARSRRRCSHRPAPVPSRLRARNTRTSCVRRSGRGCALVGPRRSPRDARRVKAWPLPALDRRDVRLHRLFVVAYSPLGYPDARRSAGHVRHGGQERVPRTVAATRGDCRAAMRLFTPTVG